MSLPRWADKSTTTRSRFFAIIAGGSKDHLAGVAAEQLDACVGSRAARDQEAGERLGDRERDRRQRALGRVSAFLKCSDPEPALRACSACRLGAG